ncbi:MAG: protease modulator HflK, partial [Alphaproteobacteria bacterium]
FLAIYNEYKKAPLVTRQRLYLETMQEVIKANPPIIIESTTGVVPYLPLPELQKRQKGGQR